jgi:hypothetical protein
MRPAPRAMRLSLAPLLLAPLCLWMPSMPRAVLDREFSEELYLGSDSAFANDNTRPDCCVLRAIAHVLGEVEWKSSARFA